jgi:hypothetical protein
MWKVYDIQTPDSFPLENTNDLRVIQDIFRRIFLSNCCWQKSDIWSQASYRYTILWVAFLDPSDSDLVGFYTHWTYMHIFRHRYTYMTLVTKYQISAINSHWEKCDEKYLGGTEAQRSNSIPLSPKPWLNSFIRLMWKVLLWQGCGLIALWG